MEVDLSQAPIYTLPKTTGEGNFYRVDFDFILLFGMTELTAQVAWMENVSNFSYFCSIQQIFRLQILLVFVRESRNGKFMKNSFLS